MGDLGAEGELHNSSWKSLVRIIRIIPTPVYVTIVFAFALGWLMSAIDESHAAAEQAKIARGLDMTARGCPAARPKIAEIMSDGRASDHEIEVLHAVIMNEQAKPGGLGRCRAPRWSSFAGQWGPSSGYDL